MAQNVQGVLNIVSLNTICISAFFLPSRKEVTDESRFLWTKGVYNIVNMGLKNQINLYINVQTSCVERSRMVKKDGSAIMVEVVTSCQHIPVTAGDLQICFPHWYHLSISPSYFSLSQETKGNKCK